MNDSALVKGFGIASFVLGVLAIIFSVIPCIGMYAAIPGFISLVMGIIALKKARPEHNIKGLIIAAVVIAFLSLITALWQYYAWKKTTDTVINIGKEMIENSQQFNEDEFLEEELNNAMDSLYSGTNDMNNALDSIE